MGKGKLDYFAGSSPGLGGLLGISNQTQYHSQHDYNGP